MLAYFVALLYNGINAQRMDLWHVVIASLKTNKLCLLYQKRMLLILKMRKIAIVSVHSNGFSWFLSWKRERTLSFYPFYSHKFWIDMCIDVDAFALAYYFFWQWITVSKKINASVAFCYSPKKKPLGYTLIWHICLRWNSICADCICTIPINFEIVCWNGFYWFVSFSMHMFCI